MLVRCDVNLSGGCRIFFSNLVQLCENHVTTGIGKLFTCLVSTEEETHQQIRNLSTSSYRSILKKSFLCIMSSANVLLPCAPASMQLYPSLSDTKTYAKNFQLSEISKTTKGIDDEVEHYRFMLKKYKKVCKAIH